MKTTLCITRSLFGPIPYGRCPHFPRDVGCKPRELATSTPCVLQEPPVLESLALSTPAL